MSTSESEVDGRENPNLEEEDEDEVQERTRDEEGPDLVQGGGGTLRSVEDEGDGSEADEEEAEESDSNGNFLLKWWGGSGDRDNIAILVIICKWHRCIGFGVCKMGRKVYG